MNSRNKIHSHLKEKHPKAIRKIKKLTKFKYPKLLILALCILLAYYIFSKNIVSNFILGLENLSYLGTFISGIFAAFGFSAPFSIGFLLVSQPANIFLAAMAGGMGAMVGDWVIFKTIKFSFMDEFNQLEKTKTIHKIEEIVSNNKHLLIGHYLLYIFAGIIIATPLPDEIGVSMLAGLTTINPYKLAIISFILHTTAIFLILLI